MSELKNTFSWSFSQEQDFKECKRKQFFSRYGMWGGWDSGASSEKRSAYRLKQMKNKWSLIGDAVETAVLEVLERRRVGSPFSAETAMQTAMSLLRSAWKEHTSEKWRAKPKKYTCISELYYGKISPDSGTERDEWVSLVRGRTEICIQNFFAQILPHIPEVTYEQIVPIARAGQGDPEHFHLGGIKVYAIPDWVYKNEGKIVVHDWKTGIRRDRHKEQLAIYGLWSQRKHNATPDEIELFIEYLESGEQTQVEYSVEIASALCDRILSSVKEMKQYLVDRDIEKNEPLPKESFPETEDLSRCKNCNFIELCGREFVTNID